MNAFLLAKGLRRLGVEADSFDLGGGPGIQLPQWEDALFDPEPVSPAHYAWSKVKYAEPWQRPPWAKILGNDDAQPWYDTQEAYEADLPRILAGYQRRPSLAAPAGNSRAPWMIPDYETDPELSRALLSSALTPEEQAALRPLLAPLPSWRSMRSLAEQYDLLVLCGPTAGYGCLLPAGRPYIAFEHATLRHVHRLLQDSDRILTAAYRHANAVVITNADCREAADCLGLPREWSPFIPHPLQEDVFRPPETEQERAIAASVRSSLLASKGAELLFVAPARHSNDEHSGSKRTDRIVFAFRRYLAEGEPAGAPKAMLGLIGWGSHVQQIQALVDALGIGDRVLWFGLLPKRHLLALYRAADIVLDQFSATVGSFGTTTVEALSCGKPVITWIDAAAHAWCRDVLPELPPVENALRTEEIFQAMLRLAISSQYRAELGAEGRRWVLRHHSLARVATMHRDLYQRVLDEARSARGLTTPSATLAPPAAHPAVAEALA